MKKTPRYADLDEFWVIGDFVAKAFMGWGGECRRCYVDSGDPSGPRGSLRTGRRGSS